MRDNFTGPSYTVGVEEELMIVDASSYALVNAIESLLEDAGAANIERTDGEIKPELMESVLEIATKPCANVERGRRPAALAAPQGARDGRRPRPDDRLGRHPPVRDVGGPADRRAPALPRPHLGAALRRAPGAHLRHARPRRHRRRRQGDPRRQRHARPRPGAARAERQLAVLARRPHRPAVHAHADLPPVPARRHAAGLRATGRTGSARSRSWSPAA